jgi:CheY-like chemotaxis protein
MRSHGGKRVAHAAAVRDVYSRLHLANAALQAASLDAHIGVVSPADGSMRFWLLLHRGLELAPAHGEDTPFMQTRSIRGAIGSGDGKVHPSGGASSGGAAPTEDTAAARATRLFDQQPSVTAAVVSPGMLAATTSRDRMESEFRGCSLPQSVVSIKHVVLVDDEVTLRRLGARMLQAQGVECDALEDGSDVAATLAPTHELLLLDIVMRQSDGVEVRPFNACAVPRARRISCACVCACVHVEAPVCLQIRGLAGLCGAAQGGRLHPGHCHDGQCGPHISRSLSERRLLGCSCEALLEGAHAARVCVCVCCVTCVDWMAP